MIHKYSWDKICQSEPEGASLWELFHENTKSTQLDNSLTNEEVAMRMQEMADSLHYSNFQEFELPVDNPPIDMPLSEAIDKRISSRTFKPDEVSFNDLAAILHSAYGITRKNEDGIFPRPFRTAPSAGAMYPLEIYFHALNLEGMKAGLYHYNPSRNSISLLKAGDCGRAISAGVVQNTIPLESSLLFFLTGIPERVTFKYGDRGYRFMLLEAGHVAQNINLAACGLGFGSLNICGYYDQKIDNFLGIDGVNHSTVYIVAVGTDAEADTDSMVNY